MALTNGLLDVATLAAVPGGLLRADAADAWIRVRAATGLDLRPTSWADTYRSYAVQERIFRERYTTSWVTGIDPRRWLGLTWWRRPGTASAAVPGTSNHGWGVAIDVTGLGGFNGSAYERLAEVAPAHGWSNTAGRQIDEAWHWEYNPAADTHPTAQEDDMPITEAEYLRLKGDMQATADSAMRGLIPTIAAAVAKAVAATPVTRVPDRPSTWLQDTVDGTTAALATHKIIATLPDALMAALPPATTGAGISLTQVEAAVKSALATLQLKSV